MDRLAAIVLNHGTPDLTVRAVDALCRSRRPIDDLFVVDNGSTEESQEQLRSLDAGAIVLRVPRNLGFSGGNNVGLRAAFRRGADLILLVNSDAVVDIDCVGRLETALAECDAGIAGAVLLSQTNPRIVLSAGIRFSGWSGRMRHHDAGSPAASIAAGDSRVVDAVSGCVMLIRRSVFDRIGLLDETYFFSFEDVEFCLRARDAGFVTICAAGAVALHEGSGTIGRRSGRRLYFASRNHLLLASQLRAASVPARTFRAASIVAFNLAHALLTAETPIIEGMRSVVQGAWHHARRRYGDRPA